MKTVSLLFCLLLLTNTAFGRSDKDLPITELKDMSTDAFGGSDLINALGYASKFTVKKVRSITSRIGLHEIDLNEHDPYAKEDQKPFQLAIDHPIFYKTKTCTVYGGKATLKSSKLRINKDYTLAYISGSKTDVNMVLFSAYTFPQSVHITCNMSPNSTVRQLEKALDNTFDISL